MSNKLAKPLAIVIGTGLIGSLPLSPLSAASPAFRINVLAGYSLAAGSSRLDTDKDGKVSKAEWKARGDQMFGEMDADRDGAISQDEWDAWHSGKEGACGVDKRGTRIVSKLDTDKDGQISRAEWNAHTEASFDGKDIDHDGFID